MHHTKLKIAGKQSCQHLWCGIHHVNSPQIPKHNEGWFPQLGFTVKQRNKICEVFTAMNNTYHITTQCHNPEDCDLNETEVRNLTRNILTNTTS
jgi:hypothetical protein